jgi:uncharacterized RDD family membrane protein YckC
MTEAAASVHFAAGDYAGFWRRLVVEIIDVVAVVALLVALAGVAGIVADDPDAAPSDDTVVVILVSWAVLVYAYFVFLKRSHFGTLGYRLCRVRLVDAWSRPPGFGPLNLRLLFAVIGPINIVLDMLWIPSDPWKQSLRDKFARTYVVRAGAQAAGPARLVYRQYYVMGMSFVFQELARADR